MKTTQRSSKLMILRRGLFLIAALVLMGRSQSISAQWSTNGTNVYYNSGNVGIGTASPTNAKVEIKLGTGPSDASMYGLALSTSATNFPTKGRIASSFDGLYLTQNAYYNGSVWAVDDTSRSTAKIVLNSYVSGESSIMFATAAANNVPDPPVRMTIDKNGNLGIGTTSPTNPFTLNRPGASIIGNWYNLGAFIEPTNNKGIHLGYDNSSQTGLIISGSNGPASNLAFWTYNGSAWGERMRLDSRGYVGIGILSPGYKLDVQGGQVNASGGLCIAGVCKTDWSQIGSGSSQWTGTSTIYYNGGNVGIGTTSPSQPLHVQHAADGVEARFGRTASVHVDMSGNQVFAL